MACSPRSSGISTATTLAEEQRMEILTAAWVDQFDRLPRCQCQARLPRRGGPSPASGPRGMGETAEQRGRACSPCGRGTLAIDVAVAGERSIFLSAELGGPGRAQCRHRAADSCCSRLRHRQRRTGHRDARSTEYQVRAARSKSSTPPPGPTPRFSWWPGRDWW